MYAFLANPPPAKKRPTQPTPPTPIAPTQTRPRSNTHGAAITEWAAQVEPGSPEQDAKRKLSAAGFRRPSITLRRTSITHFRVASNAAASFLNMVETPVTAEQPKQQAEVDLTAWGYTSVFVHLPKTPATPAKFKDMKSATPTHISAVPSLPPAPEPAAKPRIVKRFRSLSILRPRSRAKAAAAPDGSSSKSPQRAEICAVDIAKRKKAKYAFVPAPLANEIALMQFADGGSADKNIKRLMEQQAKAAGGSLGPNGVADVFRDANGGVWWDQEEEWEYAHLLGGEQAGDPEGDSQWVQFGVETEMKEGDRDALAISSLITNSRRGSIDSSLSPEFVMPVEETQDELAVFVKKPGMSVLAVPSRPRRAAKHLRKPEFVIDLAAFAPRSPLSPTQFVRATTTSPFVASFSQRRQRKGGRRLAPAPLKLSPPSRPFAVPTNSPAENRRDFLESSFSPTPLVVVPLTPQPEKKHLAKQSSKVNMRSLFRRKDCN